MLEAIHDAIRLSVSADPTAVAGLVAGNRYQMQVSEIAPTGISPARIKALQSDEAVEAGDPATELTRGQAMSFYVDPDRPLYLWMQGARSARVTIGLVYR